MSPLPLLILFIMVKDSIRQQVFEYLTGHPKTSLKKLTKEFGKYNKDTVKRYLTQFRELKTVDIPVDINIKDELKKIIKDYKQPASARVQAIREYNNIVESKPEESDDGFLKWLETHGNNTLTNHSITDTSSNISTSLTKGKDGSTSTKTKSSA